MACQQINDLGVVLSVPDAKPDIELLAYAYLRFAEEKQLPVIFWGRYPNMPLKEFLDWTEKTNILGCYVNESGKPGIGRLAGIGMVQRITDIDKFRKIEIGMAFFKEYQRRHIPEEFCEKMIDWCFRVGNANLIVGVTPVQNVAARRFSRRLGFHQDIVRLFANWHGWPADAVFSTMTRQEWEMNSEDMKRLRVGDK